MDLTNVLVIAGDIYTVSEQNVPVFYISNNLAKTESISIIFGVSNNIMRKIRIIKL